MLVSEIKCWTKEQCENFRKNMDSDPQVIHYKKLLAQQRKKKKMICFSIEYEYTKYGVKWQGQTLVDAINLKSAKNKLARKHNVKAEDIDIIEYKVVGYY